MLETCAGDSALTKTMGRFTSVPSGLQSQETKEDLSSSILAPRRDVRSVYKSLSVCVCVCERESERVGGEGWYVGDWESKFSLYTKLQL